MPFSWDNMPYTNFHELNLDWFIKKFNEIFEEWESLYTTLTQWKEDTDTDLAQWKRDTLADMDARENDLLDALDTWKRETGEDIGEWETGVIGDLNDWKQDFLDAYDAMYDRVNAIVSDTEDMVENLAEPFSTSKNYNEGDFVVYNGLLYMFTKEHSAGAWAGSDAVKTVAMEDLKDIKDNNSHNILRGHIAPGITTTISGITYTWSGDNCTISGTASSSSYNYFGSAFPIPEDYSVGDTLFIEFQKQNTGVNVLITFYNSSDQYIQNVDAITETTKTFVIPANAVKMRVALMVRNGTVLSPAVTININDIRILNSPSNETLYHYILESECLTSEDFIDRMRGITGLTVSTDPYTNEEVVTLPSTTYNKTWIYIDIPCKQMTCYLLEFFGKSTYVDYSADHTKGGMLVLEFLDSNGSQIGSKYNSDILGYTNRQYHRYGAVSPKGAAKVRLRVVTRLDCTIELSNLTLKPVKAYQGRSEKGVQIDAHLGCILTAPKNTIPAFEQAKIAGYNTCICNVKFTSDNVPVVIHDDTINATSNGTGAVSSYTYAQLLAYDFGSWFNAAYTGTKIPTLAEAFNYMSANGIRPAISLHPGLTDANLDDIAELFERYGFRDSVIKSFSYHILSYMYAKIRKRATYVWDLDQSIPEGDIAHFASDFSDVEICIESLPEYVDQTNTDLIHSYGIERSVYNLYDAAQLRKFLLMGIDRVCMDFFSDIVVPVT